MESTAFSETALTTYYNALCCELERHKPNELQTQYNVGIQLHFLGDPGVNGIILKWIFRKWDFGVWAGSS
jgi:hypothetical protein